MLHFNLFSYKVGKLYNYFTPQGKKALPRNYKWIAENGSMAIDAQNRVILFNNKKEEFIYYTP